MANENPSWGEERISNELLLKLGIRVSPRTVNKYLPRPSSRSPEGWFAMVDLPAPARSGDYCLRFLRGRVASRVFPRARLRL